MAIIHNLIARFRADTGAFDRNVRKSRTHMTRFGRDVQRMGRQLLAVAGVGGGIYALTRGFKSAIKAASDLQETQSKFNVVFRGMAKEANKWAVDFGASVGRSEESVKSWLARLQDTFVPLGYAREEAARMSKELVKLAVDVASFNNAADADVIRDFTSALVGNHETVRKYGILISENRLTQEAVNRGIADNYKELTDLEKVQLRFNTLLADTKDAQGDVARTSDSYANQIKRLNANLTDMKTALGEEIIPALTEFIQLINRNKDEINAFMRNQIDGWKAIAEGINSVKLKQPLDPFPTDSKGNVIVSPQGALPTGTLQIPPKRMQAIAEMRAQARAIKEIPENFYRMWDEEHGIKPLKVVEKKIQEINEKTKEALANQKRIYTDIARGIAGEWSSAFDQMLFEGKKFGEAMKDVFRGILRMVTQIILYEKLAKPIAAGMLGVEASTLHSGGVVGQAGRKRKVPALAFAGAPRLHGGLMGDEYPAILQRGETVVPKNGMGGGLNITFINQSGTALKQEGQPFFDGKKLIIKVVAEDYQSGGTLRKMFGNKR